MNASKIRGFLIQKPKPAKVRVTVDDETQDIALGRSYAKTADTIAALKPDLIECFSAEGALLRAMDADTPEARRSDAAAIPAGLETDPNALMLVHFSNQIHRAYEHATEIAFAKMVEVFDIMSARSESIEARLERSEAQNRKLINEQIDSEFERAEEIADRNENGELGEQMLGAMLSGLNSKGGGAVKPPVKTNGAGKHTTNGKSPAPKAD